MPTSKYQPKTPEERLFRLKGWTYRTAAKELNVNFTHLHRVIIGERESASLIARVNSLPKVNRTKK